MDYSWTDNAPTAGRNTLTHIASTVNSLAQAQKII